MKISGVRTVTVSTASTDAVAGILQNDPLSGQAANVAFSGVVKAVVGATSVTAGNPLMSSGNGGVIPWTTAGTNPCLGQALESGTAGQIITIVVAPNAAIQ